MLKGKCKIQLKDAKNGLVLFEEEHHNAVTPAIERIFASNIAGTLSPTSLCPMYSKLLGGVCLFDSTLATTDVFLPPKSTTILTAHAGQDYDVSYASVDNKVGVLDSNASTQLQNGYKWVWNWSNLQGNGTISSIALTHADTGSYWNEDLEANVMTGHFVPVEDVSNHIITPAEMVYTSAGATYERITNEHKIPLGFYEDLNHIVSIQVNENDITVHIAHFTGDGFWLWNNVGDVHDVRTYTFAPQPWQHGTWEWLGICVFYVAYDQTNKKLYFLDCGSATQGGSYLPFADYLRTTCLDLETFTVTTTNIGCYNKLREGQQAQIYASSDPEQTIPYGDLGLEFHLTAQPRQSTREPVQIPIIDGCVYVPIWWGGIQGNTTDCHLRINLTDTTDQEIIKGFSTPDFGNSMSNCVQLDLGNGRVLNANSYAWKDEDGGSVGQVINPNFVNDGVSNRFYSALQLTDNPIQFFTGVTHGDTGNVDNRRGAMLNKLFKATAFNLETPVVKTAAMTMTVEYSLYQQEEEPENAEESEQTE